MKLYAAPVRAPQSSSVESSRFKRRALAVIATVVGLSVVVWFFMPGDAPYNGPVVLNQVRPTEKPGANADLTHMLPQFGPTTTPATVAPPDQGLQLVGTAGEGDDATATVSDENGGRKILRAGDEVRRGVRLVAVERTFAVIQSGDRQTKITLH